jgi:hypothetical protein
MKGVGSIESALQLISANPVQIAPFTYALRLSFPTTLNHTRRLRLLTLHLAADTVVLFAAEPNHERCASWCSVS